METTHNEFLKLKEFKALKNTIEDGVYINILEYPYRLTIDIGCNKAVMGIECMQAEEPGKMWVKKKDGGIELLSSDDVQKDLDKKSEKLLEKHHKLIRLITCA